ncbi:hypothetical protein GCM10009836_15370 [Pseudonocardia ailaonensis]|uniref:Uncharacterized protein n=1 Tax=Pseudonocardia ailaonensis TaxID=367279 RepID=A0ABN2MU32_9PSEU
MSGREQDPAPLLSRRGRLVLIGACVVAVLIAVAYVTAQASAPGGPPVAQGQVRLGPDPGEPVADYLARLPASLPTPGTRVSALVQLSAEITTAQAATLAPSAVEAVFRVPIPRVQTALRFQLLTGGGEPALTVAQAQALHAAEADAQRQTGRPAAVAAAEAAAYRGPSCACIVALVVQADRAGLDALAATPGVRAVQAAPAGITARELALSPLLPDQATAATPPPDDGPLPS